MSGCSSGWGTTPKPAARGGWLRRSPSGGMSSSQESFSLGNPRSLAHPDKSGWERCLLWFRAFRLPQDYVGGQQKQTFGTLDNSVSDPLTSCGCFMSGSTPSKVWLLTLCSPSLDLQNSATYFIFFIFFFLLFVALDDPSQILSSVGPSFAFANALLRLVGTGPQRGVVLSG